MSGSRVMTFEELLGRSLHHAEEASAALNEEERRLEDHSDDSKAKANTLAQLREVAGIHATLSEAYARMASAVIVNRSSMHAAIEQPDGPRPS